ncbi:MDR family MFS transporter [Leucobacter sp. UT-8R-CII-1-4]|uniref:MDR family MFS transporter n=1 Tax=Leucobacter sp. UT-8R-CII-1-4 TaxID=3040075 RepID=UPI0024A97A17|nr:MDR family MFS transporter [Leucobacter sp. UT-8R-CII-1-4]MDI6021977.1 MDR family MFS transporter [Leucobacter sp. UT-8R-CII-1-4]
MSRTETQNVPAKARATSHHAEDELHGGSRKLALTGLFMAMAVSMIAMTVVGTSMPIITADLGATQTQLTWVVTATMLASAISTPIWGKLADLTNKKLLVQLSLVIFTVGSMLAGISQEPNELILFRVIQGLGAGGLGALIQIVIADIVSPLERGKLMGIMGAIMAVGTVGGPLLGGWITDAFGWRWNFYVAVPIAIAAIVMLQLTLHLHTEKRKVKIDYWGALLISIGFSSILIWVTLAGTEAAVEAGRSPFAWASWQTGAMVGGGLLALVLAVIVELRVEEPLIPMTLFKNRTFTMAVIASIAVGLGMMGTSVFLGQYMQLARGKTPTESGLLTIPMMAGLLITSTVLGQVISRTGKWKRYMVVGSFVLALGLFMMGQLRYDTSFWYVGVSMFVLGAGVGACMQNLVLVVQNTVDPRELGAASSSVNFFRTIGGTAGMSAMTAILVFQLGDFMKTGMSTLGEKIQAFFQNQGVDPHGIAACIEDGTIQVNDGGMAIPALESGQIPKLAEICEPVRTVIEEAYGHAIGDIFLYASPIAIVAIIAIIFLPNIPLGRMSNAEKLAAQQAAEQIDPASL